jgi:transposase
VSAAIESMTGARFVHDQLERAGWQVEIADARKVKGLAPLACKTDRIDAWVLAELSRRELVPALWLPDPGLRAERERARFRLFLVRKRSALKSRIHQTLMNFGHACPVSDLFGISGRTLLGRLDLPEPWRETVEASLRLIDHLDHRDQPSRAGSPPALRRPPLPAAADELPRHRLGARLHDRCRDRRHRPLRLAGQARPLHRSLPPRLPIRRQRPPRPPLQAGTQVPALGADRGNPTRLQTPGLPRAARAHARPPGQAARPAVAQVDTARRLAYAIWHMLTRNQPFAPAGASSFLAA